MARSAMWAIHFNPGVVTRQFVCISARKRSLLSKSINCLIITVLTKWRVVTPLGTKYCFFLFCIWQKVCPSTFLFAFHCRFAFISFRGGDLFESMVVVVLNGTDNGQCMMDAIFSCTRHYVHFIRNESYMDTFPAWFRTAEFFCAEIDLVSYTKTWWSKYEGLIIDSKFSRWFWSFWTLGPY